jgi:putative endonuclease
MRRASALGRYGEEVAARYLEGLGLAIVERNWRCSEGEIDIVARDGSTLVVVEVKTRSSLAFGHPAESITPRKIRRLRYLAFRWLTEHAVHAPSVRLDAISIVQGVSGAPCIEYLRGVE